MPNFVMTQESLQMMRELQKEGRSIKEIAHELSMKPPTVYFHLRKTKTYLNDPAPIRKSRRPPAIYTNTRTPYGIGDELHAGNRIFV